jgi:hypothetical protein
MQIVGLNQNFLLAYDEERGAQNKYVFPSSDKRCKEAYDNTVETMRRYNG